MLFAAAEVKSESDGSPEKSQCPSEGVEAVEASSVGAASNTQQEGQSVRAAPSWAQHMLCGNNHVSGSYVNASSVTSAL